MNAITRGWVNYFRVGQLESGVRAVHPRRTGWDKGWSRRAGVQPARTLAAWPPREFSATTRGRSRNPRPLTWSSLADEDIVMRFHREWILHPRLGPPLRVKRWLDAKPGETFPESHSRHAAQGVMDALSGDESAAREIYAADLCGWGSHNLHHLDRLNERAWEGVRKAFERGLYVIVPLRPCPHGRISYEPLHQIMPNLSHDEAVAYLPSLNSAMAEGHVTTPLRQAAFLAPLAHESSELRAFQEGATGNEYEGRKDLGNTQPGERPRFKGRGPIQLTGRAAYRAAGTDLGLDLEKNPELVATPDVGFRAARWSGTHKYRLHCLNSRADARDFEEITKK